MFSFCTLVYGHFLTVFGLIDSQNMTLPDNASDILIQFQARLAEMRKEDLAHQHHFKTPPNPVAPKVGVGAMSRHL